MNPAASTTRPHSPRNTRADGQRALLGRSAKSTPGMYTCLSGFIDQCEGIEEAVRGCGALGKGACRLRLCSSLRRPSGYGACCLLKSQLPAWARRSTPLRPHPSPPLPPPGAARGDGGGAHQRVGCAHPGDAALAHRALWVSGGEGSWWRPWCSRLLCCMRTCLAVVSARAHAPPPSPSSPPQHL